MSDLQRDFERFLDLHSGGKLTREYLAFLETELTPASTVLDAACGHRGIFSTSALNRPERRRRLVGMDLVTVENSHLDEKHVGDLAKLPFEDLAFDVVVCEWAAEHIEAPERVIAEMVRVLKPGGSLVFITPNRRNPLVLAGWLLPDAMKNLLLKRLLGEDDADLFPLYMRFNVREDMRAHARAAGCHEVLFRTYPNPDYFRWSPLLIRLCLWWHRLSIGWHWIRRYDMYLLVAYRKGS